jgi:hypothetical protein
MPSSGMRWTRALFLALLGCSPALDWREVRPEGAGMLAMFPCRPQHHRRSLALGATTTQMHLEVCSEAGQTFAIAYLDVAAPTDVSAALVALRAAAARNLNAVESRAIPFIVPGMTPDANAVLIAIRGQTPDGAAVSSQVGLFAKGVRVYQATLFGSAIDAQACDTFFSAMRVN